MISAPTVNMSSAAFDWPDLGLGTALGSNVPALPLAYLATRFAPSAAAATEGGTTSDTESG
jgi:hypothetical protein